MMNFETIKPILIILSPLKSMLSKRKQTRSTIFLPIVIYIFRLCKVSRGENGWLDGIKAFCGGIESFCNCGGLWKWSPSKRFAVVLKGLEGIKPSHFFTRSLIRFGRVYNGDPSSTSTNRINCSRSKFHLAKFSLFMEAYIPKVSFAEFVCHVLEVPASIRTWDVLKTRVRSTQPILASVLHYRVTE